MMELLYKGENYYNRKVGCFTVVGLGERKQFKNQTVQYWKVVCDCGNELELSKQKAITRNMVGCVKCYGKKVRFNDSKLWDKEIKYVPGCYHSKTRKSAEKRNLEFSISRAYIDKLFEAQNYKCAYSGLDICFYDGLGRGTASLDRIDPTVGYIEGNVQWVHKDINTIKMDLPHEKFIEMCRLVTENTGNKKIND